MASISPDLDAPWHNEKLLQLRTSKMQTMRGLNILTGIYKQPRESRVFCNTVGLADDEHNLVFHGGVDKAVHQYYPGHYAAWRAEYPETTAFEIGGFGENLVTERMNERNVCIGDKIRVGEVLLQVSLPRQPCFNLNHRFGLKGFTSQTWKKSRTGWYYRVLEEGWMGVGDEIVLVERVHPAWTIERVQEYLHRDGTNLEKLKELEQIDEFGAECKRAFKSRLAQCEAAEKEKASGGKKKTPERSQAFTLLGKVSQTPRITSFIFQLPDAGPGEQLDPGCFVRLKLPNGLIRPYSIVHGDTHKFSIGVANESTTSRGGSRYLHETLKIGDTIPISDPKESVPCAEGASNHVFIAGGVGITAFLMHLDVYEQIKWNFTLHYAVRSAAQVPFRAELEKYGDRIIIYDASKGQRLQPAVILKSAVWNTHFYVCGPTRLVEAVAEAANAVGVDPSEIHYEAFQLNTKGDPFDVELKADGRVLKVGEDETLLSVLRREGLDMESSCEVGNCGTCRVQVCEGKVEHRGSALSVEEKTEGKVMLSCVSRGVGRLLIDF